MIERLREDHGRAEFEQFVVRCTGQLLRTGYLVVWDLAEAEDLVQETLVRVARRWARVRKMDHPLAYARRVLVNLALESSERRGRQRRELSADSVDDPIDEASGRAFGRIDARSELEGALAKLPPRQRAVLVLRYFVDLPEAEVASILGCSLGTVKSTASRGLARLEQSMTSTAPEHAETLSTPRSACR
ncbi:MAG: SigE family RNA polymerase sigma factor [Solirubrobacterales bacterium]|nr:SigE family RNA polymerase sigma factor [Solirubrobacterales bacterium]